MPSRQLRNRLTTDRAAPLLFPPQIQQLPSPLEVACHSHAEALLKVDFPRGVKRICCPFDLRVPFDRYTGRGEQLDPIGPTRFILPGPTEHPVPIADGAKVLVFDPSARFVLVPAFRPLPQGAEEEVIHRGKDVFASHMAMIVGPPSQERIELPDQIFRLRSC
jgi:hypothetical protein